ncbi:MAG: glycoside hydrolase family 172 protein, partial [Planctomycetota bacterium]
FPEGTAVPSFDGSFDDKEKAALAKANQVFANRGNDPKGARSDEDIIAKTVSVGAGKTVSVCSLKGSGAVTAIKVRIKMAKCDDPIHVLRELALSIAWDGEEKPSVWAPLGDFFGTAPGINEYRSLPLGMTDDGFYAYWLMPFSNGAQINLINDGKQPREVAFEITHRAMENADELLRFHAKWHRDSFPGRDPELYYRGERYPDWPVLITSGAGRFCGFHLHVWNPNPKGQVRGGLPKKMRDYGTRVTEIMSQAGQKWWWGEGDEKFFVDDEKFPSTFGTGSEDYFGYAWAAHNPVEFESALQNQPLNKNSSLNHVSNNRFQIADNVPFQKCFEGCIEKYHPNEWPLLYSATAYWYQKKGQQDPYGAVPAKERVDYYVKPIKAVN